MKIKAIISDVGGVLVRSGDTVLRRAWEERFGLGRGELAKLVYKIEPADLATIGMVKSESIWQDIGVKFSLTSDEIENLNKDFYAGYFLNQEFYVYMKKIRKKYKTALLSNAWDNAREIYTDKYHLDDLFDLMIISAEVGMKKPNKNIFTYTFDLLGVRGDETIFIDDTFQNCRIAGKLGIHVITFTDTETVIKQMKKMLSLY